MDTREHERVLALINNPPPGSKLAAARDYGIDLTLFLHSLDLSPEDRLRELEDAQPFLEELRRATKRGGRPVTSFERTLAALSEAGIRFVVIGGVAMYARGSAHLTRDLDVCYQRTPENIEKLASALAPYHPHLRGASPDVPFVFDARTISNGMNFTLNTDLGELDLLGEVAGLGQYPQVVAYASPVTVWGRACDALSIEGLIRSKRAAGRSRDLEAVRELESLAELDHHPDKGQQGESGDKS
jgi:predicted nucleotidyltransferase